MRTHVPRSEEQRNIEIKGYERMSNIEKILDILMYNVQDADFDRHLHLAQKYLEQSQKKYTTDNQDDLVKWQQNIDDLTHLRSLRTDISKIYDNGIASPHGRPSTIPTSDEKSRDVEIEGFKAVSNIDKILNILVRAIYDEDFNKPLQQLQDHLKAYTTDISVNKNLEFDRIYQFIVEHIRREIQSRIGLRSLRNRIRAKTIEES